MEDVAGSHVEDLIAGGGHAVFRVTAAWKGGFEKFWNEMAVVDAVMLTWGPCSCDEVAKAGR